MSQPEPSQPDLPTYVIDPLEKQSPKRLDELANYAQELAEYKREQNRIEAEQRQEEAGLDEEEQEELEESDISTDPSDYDDVPESGAYITIKNINDNRYYYWQWREGPDSWGNKYIGPVDSKD